MTCPRCRLENPPGTESCDCGYQFNGEGSGRHADPGVRQPSSFGRGVAVLFWLGSMFAAIAGLYQLFQTLTEAKSAPQQAASAGIAVGIAVIPYCIARAVSELLAHR